MAKAVENRDALCKALYSRLFNHIVMLLNKHLIYGKDFPSDSKFIGVLDIYGAHIPTFPSSLNLVRQRVQPILLIHLRAYISSRFIRYFSSALPLAIFLVFDHSPFLSASQVLRSSA